MKSANAPRNFYFIALSRSGHTFIRLVIRSWFTDRTCRIINLENVNPKDYAKRADEHPHRDPEAIGDLNFIVIRDLLNWWASYVYWEYKRLNFRLTDEHIKMRWEVYRDLLREATGRINFIPNPIVIYYESFKNIRRYREIICARLGGSYTETELQKVPPSGGGSSFDGLKFDGNASMMNTENRYVEILSEDYYRNIFVEGLRIYEDIVNEWIELYPYSIESREAMRETAKDLIKFY